MNMLHLKMTLKPLVFLKYYFYLWNVDSLSLVAVFEFCE